MLARLSESISRYEVVQNLVVQPRFAERFSLHPRTISMELVCLLFKKLSAVVNGLPRFREKRCEHLPNVGHVRPDF